MAARAIPTVDISTLVERAASRSTEVGTEVAIAADRVAAACSELGFLQLVGHGADLEVLGELRHAATEFFGLDEAEKQRIAMRRGGRAWRGWFGVGDELTAGVADHKEGLYIGTELGPDSPAVRAGLPLHGPNLFPERPGELGRLAMQWMNDMVEVGRAVLTALAISSGEEPGWFDRWCAEPTVLFRIFHYPPRPLAASDGWGVAEHTDYGLLTLLAQDGTGGLEVHVGDDWVPVPPRADVIVCNLGDMMELVSGGRFRSTPHRVRPPSSDRYSFPVFLDPAWDAEMTPLPWLGRRTDSDVGAADARPRWDGSEVTEVRGRYGDYLFDKVSRVFPELFEQVFDERVH